MNTRSKTTSPDSASAGSPATGRWMALVAALLGWLFDGFEIGMFPLVGRPALGELLGAGGPASAAVVNGWFGAIMATFLIGAVLAAIAGVMWAANYGTVQHTMGFLPGLKAFTAAVFGGIGNLAGAVVGGILLGLIESIGAGYIGTLTGGVLGSHYSDIFAFIVLIIVLTLRPSGLLGERVADRA